MIMYIYYESFYKFYSPQKSEISKLDDRSEGVLTGFLKFQLLYTESHYNIEIFVYLFFCITCWKSDSNLFPPFIISIHL